MKNLKALKSNIVSLPYGVRMVSSFLHIGSWMEFHSSVRNVGDLRDEKCVHFCKVKNFNLANK
jgi:hypothetical protein